jgi:hypothetical protein
MARKPGSWPTWDREDARRIVESRRIRVRALENPIESELVRSMVTELEARGGGGAPAAGLQESHLLCSATGSVTSLGEPRPASVPPADEQDGAREPLPTSGQSPLFPSPKRTIFESVIANSSTSRSSAV